MSTPTLDAATVAKYDAERLKFLAEAAESRLKAEKLTYEVEHARFQAELEGNRRARLQFDHDLQMGARDKRRIYDFVSSVSEASAENAIAVLDAWAYTSDAPITVRISSPGGSVIAGLALYDHMLALRSKGVPITTAALGMAASMGAVLLQAGDERVIGPSAHFLVHEISSFAMGKIGEIEDQHEFSKTLNQRLFRILAERSGVLSYEEVCERAKRKDWWMAADEVLALGFADRIGYAG